MAAPAGIELTGASTGRFTEVLTPEALEFLAALHREFNPRRLELLQARSARYDDLANGGRWTSFPRPRPYVRTTRGRWLTPPLA